MSPEVRRQGYDLLKNHIEDNKRKSKCPKCDHLRMFHSATLRPTELGVTCMACECDRFDDEQEQETL